MSHVHTKFDGICTDMKSETINFFLILKLPELSCLLTITTQLDTYLR